MTSTYLHWLLSLPLSEQVPSLVFYDLVLGDNLHLQTGHLSLDGGVLTLDDVRECSPLALNVVAVHPCGGELEALTFQDALALFVQVHFFLP